MQGRGAFAGLSLTLLAAEQIARFCSILHYFVTGQLLWCWVTLALLLPGYLVQVLSFHWFRADGHKLCWTLVAIHILHLGLWKRYWNVLWSSFKAGEGSGTRQPHMEQGDLGVLRLLEALLETLPVLLLQAYTCVVMEANGLVSGLSAGMSLLSLSWALVSYSRSMCLIKPCHLSMPGTALLCQLLWRTGMIGTRVMTLVLFARTYHLWVFAAAGIHWLVMSYWTVAQQTDIFQNPCHWKLFNILTGAVYIFCYVNFKDGPSFCRMAVFYIITLSENVFLLLMSMDVLHVNSRSNLWILGAVISGSILGLVALVSYYSLLHPKSTEIWQRFLQRSHSLLSKGNKGNENLTMGSSGIPGLQDIEASGAEPAIQPLAMPSNSSLVDFGCSADGKNLCENEHHWLLIKLALKTGSISKIKTVLGESVNRDCYLVPVIKNNKSIVQSGPRRKLIFLTKEKFPISPKSRTGEQRSLTEENKVTDNLRENKEQFNITLPTSKHAPVEATPAESNLEMEGDQKEPIYSCSTVYFTVGGEGEASPDTEGKTGAVNTRNVLTEPAKTHKGSSMQSGQSGEEVLFTSADISPIVPTRTSGCLQNGPDFSASASPKPSDQQGMLRVHCKSSHAYLYRTWASVLKEKETRNATEQCCITSTPKNSSASNSHKL
uniref:XK-related protein n=1 Tax=Pogona vitticeps TaxID=103695 RepID=A0ABM5GRN8_9SAUR